MRPTTNCPADATLIAFHEGDLPPADIDEIAVHLELCMSCEFRLQAMEDNRNTIASILRESRNPPQPVTLNVDPSAKSPGSASTESSGVTIGGRYRVVEAIGEGGMGVVYMAQQVEPVRRLVAVKLVRQGLDGRLVLARFEAERQALALMDHPNIARAYDAGAEATGRPYFVMELVKGPPITTYCDERRLTTRDRLDLFVSICRAVQHAHQKGVIHRDLKPSNVLVASYDGQPVPKVIDFGIAKAIDQSLTDRTLVTGFGAIVGTPEYMSPEQAEPNQLDVDTRTDVYALGVILYELLTGSTPLDRGKIRDTPIMEVLRRIREDEPERPSNRLSSDEGLASLADRRRVEPKRLASLIKGDLDWIVMRALEKDRSRRYETADALARDVERHLAGEQVDASPPSTSARVRRWLQRRPRFAAAMAGSLAVAIIALGGLLARERFQNERLDESLTKTTTAQKLAYEQLDEAMAAWENYYTGISRDFLLQNENFRDLRDRLLEAPRNYFAKMADKLSRDPNPDRRSRDLLARGYYAHAKILIELGRNDEAEKELKSALKISRALALEQPENATTKALAAVTAMALANLIHNTGKDEGVEKYAREAIAGFEALPEPMKDRKLAAQLADAHALLAKHFAERVPGRSADADREYLKAMELGIVVSEAGDGRGIPGLALGRTRLYYSYYLGKVGRFAEALAMVHGAIECFDRSGVTEKEEPVLAQDRVVARSYLGLFLSEDPSKAREAEDAFRKAIDMASEKVAELPNVMHWKWTRLRIRSRYATFLTKSRRPADAEKVLNAAIAEAEELIAANPADSKVLLLEIELRSTLCEVTFMTRGPWGTMEKARVMMQKSESLAKGSREELPQVVLMQSRMNYGMTLCACGQLIEGEAELRIAMAAYREFIKANPDDNQGMLGAISCATNLATCLRQLRNLDQSAEFFRETIDLLRALCDRRHLYDEAGKKLPLYYRDMVIVLLDGGHLDKAVETLRELHSLPVTAEGWRYYVASTLCERIQPGTNEVTRPLLDELTDLLRDSVVERPNYAFKANTDRRFAALRDQAAFRELVVEGFDRSFPADPFLQVEAAETRTLPVAP